MDPGKVKSPRDHMQNVRTLLNGGDDNGLSYALILWDGDPVIGARYNGFGEDSLGMPLSSGYPVFFVQAKNLYEAILDDNRITDDDRRFARLFLRLDEHADEPKEITSITL